MAISLLAVIGIVALFGVVVIEEGDETYGKILAVAGGTNFILGVSYFAMKAWSLFFRHFIALNDQPTSGVSDAND
jgi:hypothetical protein